MRVDRSFKSAGSKLRETESWASWIHKFALWTHAVTLTCKRCNASGSPITPRIIEDAARHFLALLNHECVGKNRFRRGYSVASAVSYGFGTFGDHPHLHLSLACPAHLTTEEFSALIDCCADQTYWLDRERKILPYRGEGWSAYLIKHGTDELIVPLLRPSHPDG